MESVVAASACAPEGLALCLRDAGLIDEAALLGFPDRVGSAQRMLDAGRVVTVADPSYPRRWRAALGAALPPALWREGPLAPAPWVGVVGSRSVGTGVARQAFEVGQALAGWGWGVVSGGAMGCDRWAMRGACSVPGSATLELLPEGLSRRGPKPGVSRLSACEPFAEFSSAAAMERNALIYAAGAHTVVVHCRRGVGGTWAGAVDALRRRLGCVWVLGPGGEGGDALVALGARRVLSLAELPAALATSAPPSQAALFGESVHERHAAWSVGLAA